MPVTFSGVLAQVDRESDRAPIGSAGRRVLLTSDAALRALPSLIGAPVSYWANGEGHHPSWKKRAAAAIGTVTEARVTDGEIRVAGCLGALPPEAVEEMRRRVPQLGMSYELTDCAVEDMRASVWRLTEVTFDGAAIVLRERAAYRGTSFELKAES
jgi:hypothetical protein